jgi:hypothetical protein
MNEERLEHAHTFCLRVMQPSLTLSWDTQAESVGIQNFYACKGVTSMGVPTLFTGQREREREKEGGR